MLAVFGLFTAVLISLAYLVLFVFILHGKPGFDWASRPLFGLPAGLAGAAAIYCLLMGGGGVIMFFFGITLYIPCGLVAFLPLGHKMADLISGAGALGIRNLPSFDQALSAERRDQFDLAGRIYLEFFREARKRGFSDAEMAEGHLAYGNLLQRLGRPAEAAEHWEIAAAGQTLGDRAQIAAMRAADVRLSEGRIDRARAILADAVSRHPEEPVTAALRQRLSQLPP